MRSRDYVQVNGNGAPQQRVTRIRRKHEPQHRLRYSLADTDRLGIPVWMRTVTFLIGLGSAASRAVCHTADHALHEWGFIPDVFSYLCFDADADFPPAHREHCFALGVDGSGTDATVGLELFLAKLGDIADVLISRFHLLLGGDHRCPTEATARQATSIHLVAGSGGTSGGAVQPMITLLHDIAGRMGILELRVHVHWIGPEVALLDINRTITPEQNEIVHATFAANLTRSFADLAVDRLQQHMRSDGTTFCIRSRLRVLSQSLTGRSNGQVDSLTSADTEANMGWTLLQRCFTAAGIHHEGRTCDHRVIGAAHGFVR